MQTPGTKGKFITRIPEKSEKEKRDENFHSQHPVSKFSDVSLTEKEIVGV